MTATCFQFQKIMLTLHSFLQSGRWSSKEALLKYFTIPPAFLTSEGQTRKLQMRTLIVFKKFVWIKPPQSHDVRLVTI